MDMTSNVYTGSHLNCHLTLECLCYFSCWIWCVALRPMWWHFRYGNSWSHCPITHCTTI